MSNIAHRYIHVYNVIEKKEQDILKEAAAHLLFSIQTQSIWENFAESVKAMPSSLNHNQNELNDLYDALKSVAEADGIIDIEERLLKGKWVSEHSVLEFVSAEWGLGGNKAEQSNNSYRTLEELENDTYLANNCVCETVSKIDGDTLQSYIDDYMMYECDGCGRDINPSFGWYPISFDEYLED